jgi:hypothetical protein
MAQATVGWATPASGTATPGAGAGDVAARTRTGAPSNQTARRTSGVKIVGLSGTWRVFVKVIMPR